MFQHNFMKLRTKRIMYAPVPYYMIPGCELHGINTSTLHVDGRTFHVSLQAPTRCPAQDGRPSPLKTGDQVPLKTGAQVRT